MKFSISSEVLSAFPTATVGVIIARNLSVKKKPELRVDASLLVGRDLTIENLTAHPHISCWREAYKKFGSKPYEYRASVEALVRRILRNGSLDSIDPLVDIYNYISVKHLFPVGGEDMDKMEGDLQLRFASVDEKPALCLGQQVAEVPYAGEVMYADDGGAICRRWNWREVGRTALSSQTRNAFMCIDSCLADQSGLKAATHEFLSILQEHYEGEFSIFFVDGRTSSIEF